MVLSALDANRLPSDREGLRIICLSHAERRHRASEPPIATSRRLSRRLRARAGGLRRTRWLERRPLQLADQVRAVDGGGESALARREARAQSPARAVAARGRGCWDGRDSAARQRNLDSGAGGEPSRARLFSR